MMFALNIKAAEVMNRLTTGLNRIGDHKRIDNAPGVFMYVSIERINETRLGSLFSVAHYYEQNGDLMRDPDMTFIKGEDELYYPVSFQQDNLAYYREAVFFENGQPVKFSPKIQKDQAMFANEWMANIKAQQRL